MTSPRSTPPVIGLVSEFPPPAAGMTVQAETLRRQLETDGFSVLPVITNAQLPRPLRWIGRIRFVRGAVAWLRFAVALRKLRRADVVHVFAASWLNFFLFTAPAAAVAAALRRPLVVHYHGGAAADFLARWARVAVPILRSAVTVVVPSVFLQEVFGRHGVDTVVVPNPVDVEHQATPPAGADLVVLSCRNFSPVYDISTAIRAFARLHASAPGSRLRLAGDGPDRAALKRLVDELGLADAVEFLGNVPHADMDELRASCHVLLNTSRVDNQPVSLIEALAAGLPIVSTDAGGIPDLVAPGRTALLAAVGDSEALGDALCGLARDPELYAALRAAGLRRAEDFAWGRVGSAWSQIYAGATAREIAPAPRTSTASARKSEVRL